MQKWDYLELVLVNYSRLKLLGNEWEWKWDDDDNNYKTTPERLNELGRQGWELVSVTTMEYKNERNDVNQIEYHYYFKRPLE